jgi:hypothetical protein
VLPPTYDAAKRDAKAIREAVLERRMPPWLPARGFGDFSIDRSLTPIEIELLTSWVDGGTPIGPPITAPPPTSSGPSGRIHPACGSQRIDAEESARYRSSM